MKHVGKDQAPQVYGTACRSASREGGDGKTQAEALRLDDVVPANTKAGQWRKPSVMTLLGQLWRTDSRGTSRCFWSVASQFMLPFSLYLFGLIFKGLKGCCSSHILPLRIVCLQSLPLAHGCIMHNLGECGKSGPRVKMHGWQVCLLKADCHGCEADAFHSGKQLLEAGAIQVRRWEVWSLPGYFRVGEGFWHCRSGWWRFPRDNQVLYLHENAIKHVHQKHVRYDAWLYVYS